MREPPCITRPKRNALIRPATGFAGLCGELKGDLRHVDDHPVWVGQGERAHLDFLREIKDKARLRVIAAEPDVARDGKIPGGAGLGRSGAGRPDTRPAG